MPSIDNAWIGIGFESGGEIVVGGAQQAGMMFSYGDLVAARSRVRYFSFQQQSATIGLGLGGAGGINFVVGLNGATPIDYDGVSDLSWKAIDFSLDMGLGGFGRITGLARYFRSAPEIVELAAMARKFDGNLLALARGLERYDSNARLMKDAAEGFFRNAGNAVEAMGGSPLLIALPLPGASMGLRASIKFKFESTEVRSWGTIAVGGR